MDSTRDPISKNSNSNKRQSHKDVGMLFFMEMSEEHKLLVDDERSRKRSWPIALRWNLKA